MRRFLAVPLATFAAAAAFAPASQASIYTDCADGSLSGSYSQSQINSARKNMPAGLTYSDCSIALENARATNNSSGADNNANSGATGNNGSENSAKASNEAKGRDRLEKASGASAERRAKALRQVKEANAANGGTVKLGNDVTIPEAALSLGSASNRLPGPLKALAITGSLALLLGLAGLAAKRIRNRSETY